MIEQSERVTSILQQLCATAESQRLYGEEHPARTKAFQAMQSSIRHLAAELPERTKIEVLLMRDRVVYANKSLPAGKSLLKAGLARLTRHEACTISIPLSPVSGELETLASAVEHGVISASAGRLIRGGTLNVSTGQPETPAPAAAEPNGSEELRDALSRVWSGVEQSDQAAGHGLPALLSALNTATAAHSSSILRLSALRDHDDYTFVHTVNVGILSSALAAACGVSGNALEDLTVAAMLHDMGKALVPESFLSKAGKLSVDERQVVERHPAFGAAQLTGARGIPEIAAVVAYEHHMRLDGGGYPARHRHWKISFASQVVQICDIFDALRTHRPYRAALEPSEALEILSGLAGGAFDREIFTVFQDQILESAEQGREMAFEAAPDPVPELPSERHGSLERDRAVA